MANAIDIKTDKTLSKNELMNELHQLTIEGIKLISKHNKSAELGFEQYFLSMLELQTRPFSSEELSPMNA